MTCIVKRCLKQVYFCGYILHVCEKYEVPTLAGTNVVACTKDCQLKNLTEMSGLGKEFAGRSRKSNWNTDGKQGLDDPNMSMKILLDWWMTHGNYEHFCGKKTAGVKNTFL